MICLIVAEKYVIDECLTPNERYRCMQYPTELPNVYKILLNNYDKNDYVYFKDQTDDPVNDRKVKTADFLYIVNRTLLYLETKLINHFEIKNTNPLSFNSFRFLYVVLNKFLQKSPILQTKSRKCWKCYLNIDEKQQLFYVFNPNDKISGLFSAVNAKFSEYIYNKKSLDKFDYEHYIDAKDSDVKDSDAKIVFLQLNGVMSFTYRENINIESINLDALEKLYYYCCKEVIRFLDTRKHNVNDQLHRENILPIKNYIIFILREYFAELIVLELITYQNRQAKQQIVSNLKSNKTLSNFCDITMKNIFLKLDKQFQLDNLSILVINSPIEILKLLEKNSRLITTLFKFSRKAILLNKIIRTNEKLGLFDYELPNITLMKQKKLVKQLYLIDNIDQQSKVVDILIDTMNVRPLYDAQLKSTKKIHVLVTQKYVYWIDQADSKIFDLPFQLKVNLIICEKIYKLIFNTIIIQKSIKECNSMGININTSDAVIKQAQFMIINYLFNQNFILYLQTLLNVTQHYNYTMEMAEEN